MNLRNRRLVFGSLAIFFLLVATVFWLLAVWQTDPDLAGHLGYTGAIMLIPTVLCVLACVDWRNV